MDEQVSLEGMDSPKDSVVEKARAERLPRMRELLFAFICGLLMQCFFERQPLAYNPLNDQGVRPCPNNPSPFIREN